MRSAARLNSARTCVLSASTICFWSPRPKPHACVCCHSLWMCAPTFCHPWPFPRSLWSLWRFARFGSLRAFFCQWIFEHMRFLWYIYDLQIAYTYENLIRDSLGVVRLNMCGISLLGLVDLNKDCPDMFPSTSIFHFVSLFPTSSPTVPVLPIGDLHL